MTARPRPPAPGSDRAAAWLLRGLGAVYAVAGASLWVQVIGLIGARGITPAAERAAAATASFAAWWQAPSVLWFLPTDRALHAACAVVVAAGLALALLPTARLASRAGTVAALAAWAGYLSLVSVGGVFLGYQWDALLCESGFLAIWLTRALPRAPGDGRSATRVLWLFRLLVARLMFASGIVKLRGDDVWRDLTALRYHFMTQPLPTVSAWWAHQLPPSALRALTAAVLAIELVAPLLVLGPPRARRWAAALFLALQLAIAATGNYGFFNLLTAVLCLSLLGGTSPALSPAPPRGHRRVAESALIALVCWLTAAPLAIAVGWVPRSPAAAPLFAPFVVLAPWRVVNPYGLFADMTTTRPELVIEGTLDGRTWRPYALPWLPGNVRRPPRTALGHMPRLDWQLWFAALQADAGGGVPDWLIRFLDRLRSADPTVLALLAGDPFAGRPPLAVRAVLVDDRFTDVATRRRSGAWWAREGDRVVARRPAE